MNRKDKNRVIVLLLGATAGLCAAWFVQRRQQQEQQLPRTKKMRWLAMWQRVLVERHGAAQAEIYAKGIQNHYSALLGQCAIPTNPALRKHLYENILPGLALYQVLLPQYNGDQKAALAEIDEIFRVWTIEKARPILGPIAMLPIPFRMLKQIALLELSMFPSEGWDFTYIENSSTRLAVNITRCFYVNTLTALGAPELTASFCKTDDVIAELFPASLRFIRPHTLGRGDAMCDFQYCQGERSTLVITGR